MSDKPYLKELKDICGSDKLHDCFIFLNIQEIPINEVFRLNTDEEMAAEDVYDSIHEVQLIERRLVESLASVVADFQRLIALKKETIEILEKYDEE